MTARKYFAKTERSLLRWDVDDSNNTMGAFLRLVWLVLRFLKKGLLMSYGKTKTLELEILGLRGKQLVLVDLQTRVDF
jgi:hypothetical protein